MGEEGRGGETYEVCTAAAHEDEIQGGEVLFDFYQLCDVVLLSELERLTNRDPETELTSFSTLTTSGSVPFETRPYMLSSLLFSEINWRSFSIPLEIVEIVSVAKSFGVSSILVIRLRLFSYQLR